MFCGLRSKNRKQKTCGSSAVLRNKKTAPFGAVEVGIKRTN